MKKLILTLLTLFTISVVSFSQKEMSESDIEAKELFLKTKNSISFAPLNLFNQELLIGYERKFGANNSFVVFGSFKHNAEFTKNNIFTIGGEIHYRRYLYFAETSTKKRNKKYTIGLYAAPVIGFEHHESKLSNGLNYYDAAQIGFVTGLNYTVFEDKLNLGFYLGFVDKLVTKTNMQKPGAGAENPIFYPNKMGIIPKGNFYVGFTF